MTLVHKSTTTRRYDIRNYGFTLDSIREMFDTCRNRLTPDEYVNVTGVLSRNDIRSTRDELLVLCELERLSIVSKFAIIDRLD
jgi:hypothetical protein